MKRFAALAAVAAMSIAGCGGSKTVKSYDSDDAMGDCAQYVGQPVDGDGGMSVEIAGKEINLKAGQHCIDGNGYRWGTDAG